MLLDFENDIDWRRHLESIADDSQGLIDRRHVGGRKLHVYSRTGNLNNVSNIFWHKVRLAFVSFAISIQHSAFSTAISLPKPAKSFRGRVLNADCCPTAPLPR